jgi:hypothetical protein
MSSFEDRKKSFENKFARDEEVRFKIFAKRNKPVKDIRLQNSEGSNIIVEGI